MGSFSNHQKRMVVLVPFPLQGHMTPMLQLGSILHSKGFSITVAHPGFNSPNPLNHPEFVFVPLADKLLSEAGSDDTSDPAASFMMKPMLYITAMNENCRQPLVDYLVQSDDQICCIIYDAIMCFGEAVASQLKIPSIFLSILSAAYLQSLETVVRFHAENRLPVPDWQLDNPVPGLNSLRFKDLPVRVSSAIPDVEIQFLDCLTKIKSSAAIICNTTQDLELSMITQLSQRHKVPFFPIGPFHKMAPSSSSSSTSYLEEDSACIPWLDKQAPNSVLYLSNGSLATINEKEIEETAWGLENSGQPFLWVIRSSLSLLLLPKGFQERVGERGLIVKWAPQKEVLAHPAVGGFLSHCGWNSTLESISEAVPLICRPCFSDQIVNSRYLTHVWKVGLELEHDSDRMVIERTVRKLMVDYDQRKEMRDRMLDLKRKMESSVQEGGSSYTSLNNLADFISSLPLQKS